MVQYNKCDRSDPYALEELHRKLDLRGAAAFEAVASEGTAVLQTLTTISKRVMRVLRDAGDAPAHEEPAPVPRSVGAGALDAGAAPPEEAAPLAGVPLPEIGEEDPAGKTQQQFFFVLLFFSAWLSCVLLV